MTIHPLNAPAPLTYSEITLAGMLAWPRVIDDVCQAIHGGDFRDARDELIFDAIVAQQAAGLPTDPVGVADRLAKDGTLARAGGPARLHDIVARNASAANAEWAAQRVREEAMMRAVAAAGTRLIGYSQDESASEGGALDLINAARTELDALATDDHKRLPNEQAVYQAVAALEDPPGMPTPWPQYTRVIAGLKPGGMYVFAARPGVGKTLVAQAIALDVARRGKTAVLHALEMTSDEMYHRIFSSVAGLATDRIQHRTLTRADHEKIAKAAASVAGLGDRLVIDDRGGVSVAQIRAQARALRRKGELGVVIVDHIGLVKAPRGAPRDNREQQVSAISWELKLLAKDLGVPVVVMSQLNRKPESRADGRPLVSDLRESGAVEQNADVVTLLHRDMTDKNSPEASRLWLLTGKNRHGPQMDVELLFQGHFSRVVEHP